jgi:hypothetical protein
MEISEIILGVISLLSIIINLLNEYLAYSKTIKANSVGQLIIKKSDWTQTDTEMCVT